MPEGIMGESSACLMPSFSQTSPTSTQEKKGNPINRALTTSVSFGRFMSESLDWGKWSAFTHNRYLEEVEKYSKPGSVAEKKAYFEAHFKRRRAAALLEQQNVEASNSSEKTTDHKVEDVTSSSDLGFEQKDSHLVSDNTKEGEVRSCSPVAQNGSFDERASEDAKPKVDATEPLALVENPVELINDLGNNGCFGDIVSKIEDKLRRKDEASPINLAPYKKNPEVSCSKLVANDGASECVSPVKVIKPVQLKNSDKTPDSKSKAMDSSNKRRSYTTSLHISINFPPKIEKRTVRSPAKKYKNSIPQTSSARASANGPFKHHSATPQSENSRIMKPHADSVSRVRTVDDKAQSLSSTYSKFSNVSGIKARVPTVPSSFTFKSEERAVKRREFFQKLEQKTKSVETEKHQMHAKPQVKARGSDKDLARGPNKDLRNSIALETTKNAEFPSRCLTKKVLSGRRPCFGKIEERASAFRVEYNDSRPPWRLPAKTQGSNNFTGKNPSYSTKGFIKNENASPNIQL